MGDSPIGFLPPSIGFSLPPKNCEMTPPQIGLLCIHFRIYSIQCILYTLLLSFAFSPNRPARRHLTEDDICDLEVKCAQLDKFMPRVLPIAGQLFWQLIFLPLLYSPEVTRPSSIPRHLCHLMDKLNTGIFLLRIRFQIIYNLKPSKAALDSPLF